MNVAYSKEEKALEFMIYDGEEGTIILLTKDQAELLIEQIDKGIQDHDKDNVLN